GHRQNQGGNGSVSENYLNSLNFVTTFFNGGNKREMEGEKKRYEEGLLNPPRKIKPLFSIGKACDESGEDEEMEEDGEQPLSKRPTRAAAMHPIKREPSPSPTGKRKSAAARAISLPPTGLPLSAKPPKSASPAGSPTVPTASPTVPTCSTVLSTTPSPPGTVTLDMIFAKICEVHTDVQKLAVRVERVEKKQRGIVNDTVGIRHETKEVVESSKRAEDKMEALISVVQVLRERLPPQK
ncbi:hypothetical protein PMAYCL1PPCAC_03421, partial [Pristionchus mayeri]